MSYSETPSASLPEERRRMTRSVQRVAATLALAAACVVRPTETGAQQPVPALLDSPPRNAVH